MVQPQPFQGGARGMLADWKRRDLPDTFAQRLLNCFYEDGKIRPRAGTVPASVQAGGQFDTTNYPVCLARVVKGDGTPLLIMIDIGETATIYDTAARTETTYDLTLIDAGATYDNQRHMDWTALYDKVVFTDGLNTPFMYDATLDTWTLLSDAPLARSVTTYYQKIVFGNITETGKENRIEWSEEGQPAVGYDTGGYDNYWVFGQIDPGPVVGVVGTNEALYVFKKSSIASVRGPTEDAFTTSGTREDISTTHGLHGPLAVTQVDQDIYFMTPFYKAMRMRGGRLETISEIEEEDVDFLKDWKVDNIVNEWDLNPSDVWVWYDTRLKHVHFYVHDTYLDEADRINAVYSVHTSMWHEEEALHTYLDTVYPLATKPCAFVEGAGYTGISLNPGYAKVLDRTTEYEVYWSDDRPYDITNVPFVARIFTKNYGRERPHSRKRWLTFNFRFNWRKNTSGQVADFGVYAFVDQASRPAANASGDSTVYAETPTADANREGSAWRRAADDLYGQQTSFCIWWATGRDVDSILEWQGAFVELDTLDNLSFS